MTATQFQAIVTERMGEAEIRRLNDTARTLHEVVGTLRELGVTELQVQDWTLALAREAEASTKRGLDIEELEAEVRRLRAIAEMTCECMYWGSIAHLDHCQVAEALRALDAEAQA